MSFRALVMGIGGTGKMTIFALRERLIQKWGNLKDRDDIGFLVLDTDYKGVTFEKKSTNGKESLQKITFKDTEASAFSAEEFLHLTVSHDEMKSIKDKITDDQLFKLDYPFLAPWLDTELLKERTEINGGAEQIRQLGRFAFQMNISSFEKLLDKVIRRIDGDGEKRIYLIGSLLGGTGAGLVLDVAHYIKYKHPHWDIFGIFVTATGSESQGYPDCRHNCYAALKEMNHFFNTRQDHRYRLTWKPGVQVDSPMKHCYIVSEKNIVGLTVSKDNAPEEISRIIASRIYMEIENRDFADEITAPRKNADQYYGSENNDKFGAQCLFYTMGISTIEYPLETIINACASIFLNEIFERICCGKNITEESQQSLQPQLAFFDEADFARTLAETKLIEAIKDNFPKIVPSNEQKSLEYRRVNIEEQWRGEIDRILYKIDPDSKQRKDSVNKKTGKVMEALNNSLSLLAHDVKDKELSGKGNHGRYFISLIENMDTNVKIFEEKVFGKIRDWLSSIDYGIKHSLLFIERLRKYLSENPFAYDMPSVQRSQIESIIREIEEAEKPGFLGIRASESDESTFIKSKYDEIRKLGCNLIEKEAYTKINDFILPLFYRRLEGTLEDIDLRLKQVKEILQKEFQDEFKLLEETSRSLLKLPELCEMILSASETIDDEINYHYKKAPRNFEVFFNEEIRGFMLDREDKEIKRSLHLFEKLDNPGEYKIQLIKKARALFFNYFKTSEFDIIRLINKKKPDMIEKTRLLTTMRSRASVLAEFNWDGYSPDEELQWIFLVGLPNKDDSNAREVKGIIENPKIEGDETEYKRGKKVQFFSSGENHRIIFYREFGPFPIRTFRYIQELKKAYENRRREPKRNKDCYYYTDKNAHYDPIEMPSLGKVYQAIGFFAAARLAGIVTETISRSNNIAYTIRVDGKPYTYEGDLYKIGINIANDKNIYEYLLEKVKRTITEQGYELVKKIHQYKDALHFVYCRYDSNAQEELEVLRTSVNEFIEGHLHKYNFDAHYDGSDVFISLNKKSKEILYFCPYCNSGLTEPLPEFCPKSECEKPLNHKTIDERISLVYHSTFVHTKTHGQPPEKVTEEKPVEQKSPEQKSPDSEKSRCFQCGYDKIEEDDKFCPQCRSDLSAVQSTCPHCSGNNILNGIICRNCKTVIKCFCCNNEKIEKDDLFCPICKVRICCNKYHPLKTPDFCTQCGEKYPENIDRVESYKKKALMQVIK